MIWLRSLLTGREREDLEGLWRWLDSAAAVGQLGILWDLLEGSWQRRTLNFFAGPLYGGLTAHQAAR